MVTAGSALATYGRIETYISAFIMIALMLSFIASCLVGAVQILRGKTSEKKTSSLKLSGVAVVLSVCIALIGLSTYGVKKSNTLAQVAGVQDIASMLFS